MNCGCYLENGAYMGRLLLNDPVAGSYHTFGAIVAEFVSMEFRHGVPVYVFKRVRTLVQ